jgi:hypothetical protein
MPSSPTRTGGASAGLEKYAATAATSPPIKSGHAAPTGWGASHAP